MDDSAISLAPCRGDPGDELADPAPLDSRSHPSRLEAKFPPALVGLAKRIKAVRESRGALLDPSLFGEPAWNILLALYVAAGERYALSISALSAESGVPATTAARSINRLLQRKMVRRVPNPSDNRSSYIELTGATAATLTALLENAHYKHLAG